MDEQRHGRIRKQSNNSMPQTVIPLKDIDFVQYELQKYGRQNIDQQDAKFHPIT